jgi:hypothetical protein
MGFEGEHGTDDAGAFPKKADYDGPGMHRVAFVRAVAPFS